MRLPGHFPILIEGELELYVLLERIVGDFLDLDSDAVTQVI